MKVPSRQLAPSGKIPNTAGNYMTGSGLGVAGEEFGKLIGNVGGALADVGGYIAKKREDLALLQNEAVTSDLMTKFVAEQNKSPVVDDNGFMADIDPQAIEQSVDDLYSKIRDQSKNLSEMNRAGVESMLAGRRQKLIEQVLAKQQDMRDQFYRKTGPERAYNLFHQGRQIDGERWVGMLKQAYPDMADVMDRKASEGTVWGIFDNEGLQSAMAHLKDGDLPGLTTEDKSNLAFAMKRAEENLGQKKLNADLSQARANVLKAVDVLDAGGDGFKDIATQVPGVQDEGVDDKRVNVGQTTLFNWLARKDKVVHTNYPKAFDMFGKALDQIGSKDQYEFRMRTAEARYGENAGLDPQTYDTIKSLIGRDYKVHDVSALKDAYNEIDVQRRAVGVGDVFGGPRTVFLPITSQAKCERFNTFLSWFEKETESRGGKSPDAQECVTAAKYLGVKQSSDKVQVIPPTEIAQKFGKASVGLDDAAVPDGLRKKIDAARANGWTDDAIMSTPVWQNFVKAKQ